MLLLAMILYCKAILGLETTWANEMNLVMNQASDAGSMDLLTSSPAHYQVLHTPLFQNQVSA